MNMHPMRVADSEARGGRDAERPDAGEIPAARPPARPHRPPIRTIAVAGLVVFLAGGWAAERWAVPRRVELLRIVPGVLEVELLGPASLDALARSAVGPRAQGTIASVTVDRGDTVAAGTVVATLASEDLARALQSSEAAQAAARSAVRLAEAERDRAAAALANARATLERQERLFARGVVADAGRETAQAAARQAEADAARAAAAIEQAEAQAEAAAAEVAIHRLRLQDATIRAPIDGVVVSRDRWIGDGVAPGSTIMTIADPASIVFTARFDESVIARIRPGQAAELRLSRGEGTAIGASVVSLSRSVDAETREFSADLKPERLPDQWAIGQRAVAAVVVATRPDVLAVPPRAIERRGAAASLWVEEDGRIRRRPVELGAIGRDGVEIRAGLAAGERVLADPRKAFFGMRVEPRRLAS